MRTKADYWLTEDGLIKLTAWARDGLVYREIAHNIGIAESTLREWKEKHPSISEALSRGREVADIVIENALYKRALGYTQEIRREAVTKNGEVVSLREQVHFPPDYNSARFWLTNRRPDLWKDKRETSVSAKIEQGDPFDGLTTDELRKIVQSGE